MAFAIGWLTNKAQGRTASLEMATRKLERRPSARKSDRLNTLLTFIVLVEANSVDRLYHHFLKLDKDGNGVIDRDEFMSIPSVASNPLASRLLEIFDVDKGGTIDFNEFVSGLSIFSPKARRERKLKFAFDVYDIDQDGYISNGELFIVLKLMSGDHLKDWQLQNIVDKTIRDADTRGDGRISFEEFCAIVEAKNASFLDRWNFSAL